MPGIVNSPFPFLLFGGRGNFLSSFCAPISPTLCSNKVKVCLPIPEDGTEKVTKSDVPTKERELNSLMVFLLDAKTSTK